MVKEVQGLYVAVKYFGAQARTPSVSTQVAVLRRLLSASVSSANVNAEDENLGGATGAGTETNAFADVASVSLAAFQTSSLPSNCQRMPSNQSKATVGTG